MNMKKVEAILHTFQLDAVKEALSKEAAQGMTVTEVEELGRSPVRNRLYRGAEYPVELSPKVKIEVLVDDAIVEHVVGAIVRAGRTGRGFDGEVFVQPVQEVVRIRTGERGESAL